MNYSDIIREIAQATSFDLYRLHVAIGRMLDDPKRIREVKKFIHPGDEIEYFDSSENRAIKARLLKYQRSKVLVENLHDHKRWIIPSYAINVHRTESKITEPVKEGLGRNEVAVADWVGFIDREGIERYGKVTRLNAKTVTLYCGKVRWRVSYGLLFKVLEPDAEQLQQILGSHK